MWPTRCEIYNSDKAVSWRLSLFPSPLRSMDLQPHSEPEFTVVATSLSGTQSSPYPGSFFPGASRFIIGGGVFTSNVTNNVYNPPQEQPSAFRTILLGDIKLIKELRLDDESRIVGRQTRGAGVRRMYCAKVMGGETGPMTVAMYQGAGAEEKWRQHRAKYESIRHPNIMQLYGLVATGIRALVFHDELIPYHQFLGRFQYSPVLTTYIRGYCSTEWKGAAVYCRSVFLKLENSAYWALWIRPATGELCVDLVSTTIMDGPTHIGLGKHPCATVGTPIAGQPQCRNHTYFDLPPRRLS
ncbi:hypothetical protein B0H14DRAFT_1335826 [Mycena olivaceomarginata]|nr:hypothetical protein B0H14DRAFT_1335826 [Mycena olivaceomarginata]